MSEERPETENTDEIVCPYCAHEFSDSWEHSDDDGQDIDCGSCERSFTLHVQTTTTFTTSRLDCEDQAKSHEWGEPYCYHYDAIWIAQHHASNPRIYKADEKPHSLWLRDCKHCDENDSETVELNAPCPWPSEVAA